MELGLATSDHCSYLQKMFSLNLHYMFMIFLATYASETVSDDYKIDRKLIIT